MPISPSEYETLAESVLLAYEEAERTMLRRVSKRLAKGVTSPGWTEQKYSEARAVREEIQTALDTLKNKRTSLLRDVLQQSYDAGADAFTTEAEKFTDLLGITRISPNSRKVASILMELDDTFNASDRIILRTARDAYSNIVGNVSAQVAAGTITTREAVQREVDMFADRGITSFVDKAGRAWEMATYAEMATITAIENASLSGYVDTMQSYGFDLAVISSHVGACPLCAAWEGVIVSVSGNDRDYPSLDDARAGGAFHPRCLHYLSTYYPGITKGARSRPRKVQEPNANYTARQRQRYMERQIRKWKRRMSASITPEGEREAYARVRMWQGRVRQLVNEAPKTIGEWLPRKYWREGGRTKLSAAAQRLKPVSIPMQNR